MSDRLQTLEDRILVLQDKVDCLKYDPNEPRDEGGKWTDGGGTFGNMETEQLSSGGLGLTRSSISSNLQTYDSTIDRLASRQGWSERAVRIVTGDGYKPHFETITDALRGKGFDAAPREVKAAVNELDRMMAHDSAKLDQALTVWRGWRADPYYEQTNRPGQLHLVTPKTDFKTGDIFGDKGFFMTTLSPNYAMGATASRVASPADRGKFPVAASGNVWDPNRVVFKLTLQPGQRALVPPTKAAAPASLRSGRRVTNREAIVLLPRNSTFQVTRVHPATAATFGARVVELKVLHHNLIKYDPNEPRDDRGRWTNDGGGAPSTARDLSRSAGADTQPVHSIDELYQRARLAEPGFKSDVEHAASLTRGRVVYTPAQFAEPGTKLKSRASAERKLRDELKGDATQLRDVLRATIIHSTFAESRQAAAGFIQAHSGDIVRVKDRGVNPTAGGYRDLLVNYRTKSGLIAEVQFNTRAMSEVKAGVGHRLYEQMRSLNAAGQPLSAEALRAIHTLEARSKAAYDHAYHASGNGHGWKL